MRKAVEGTLTLFSLLLISAHFLRAGNPLLSAGYLSLFFLWFSKSATARKILQTALLVGIGIYTYTAYQLITKRITYGLPYMKTAIIMAGVNGFIFLAFLVLTYQTKKR
ncbi:hypothetical protein [Desulfurobacterium sp.]|uniref:hypothetical protein n=1 Tax=Desulfurobacterium sp. TaxID=2004706 RepID=UPI00262ABCB9|nr:hypothetical protein [Desulfurobacterium sp.]